MKKKTFGRKLVLNKETISNIDDKELKFAIGGQVTIFTCYSCAGPEETCVYTNEQERCYC
jgi:hypothetical protein